MATEALLVAAHDPADYKTPASFEQFVEDLRAAARSEGEPIISPRLFASALSMDLQTLANLSHVHRITVSRAPGAEKLQTFLRDAIRVLGAAADINGSLPDALFWFRNEPIDVFGYENAEKLVSNGRAEDLLRYLRSLQAGFLG